jgi:hypothetical protein
MDTPRVIHTRAKVCCFCHVDLTGEDGKEVSTYEGGDMQTFEGHHEDIWAAI